MVFLPHVSLFLERSNAVDWKNEVKFLWREISDRLNFSPVILLWSSRIELPDISQHTHTQNSANIQINEFSLEFKKIPYAQPYSQNNGIQWSYENINSHRLGPRCLFRQGKQSSWNEIGIHVFSSCDFFNRELLNFMSKLASQRIRDQSKKVHFKGKTLMEM